MNNKIKTILTGLIVILLLVVVTYKEKIIKKEYQNTDLNMVLSLEDEIKKNSVWCGTFNLIWNDLKKDVVKQDIVFSPQPEIVKNLNKGTFTAKELQEKDYYKVLGRPTFALKEQIKDELQRKFKEKSDILDDFEWQEEENEDYFLYTMLKKEFTFPKIFTKLEKGNFKNTSNVDFFGINSKTGEEVYYQVKVLYYKDENNFAITLETEEQEEVILMRGGAKKTFLETYEEIKQEQEKYAGSKSFTEGDSLKVPYIDFKIKKEWEELEYKDFYFANGEKYYIEKAIQTISFELNEKGGKLKSEAGMHTKNTAAVETRHRKFHLEDTFTLFLKEKEASLPYFGAYIDDISKFN